MVECNLVDYNKFDLLGLDTMAGHHVISNPSLLHDFISGPVVTVCGFDGSKQISTTYAQCLYYGLAIYCKNGQGNVLSKGQLINDGYSVQSSVDARSYVVSYDGTILGTFILSQNNCYFNGPDVMINSTCEILDSVKDTYTKDQYRKASSFQSIHVALGHPSDQLLVSMLKNGLILHTDLCPSDIPTCRSIMRQCL